MSRKKVIAWCEIEVKCLCHGGCCCRIYAVVRADADFCYHASFPSEAETSREILCSSRPEAAYIYVEMRDSSLHSMLAETIPRDLIWHKEVCLFIRVKMQGRWLEIYTYGKGNIIWPACCKHETTTIWFTSREGVFVENEYLQASINVLQSTLRVKFSQRRIWTPP